MKKILLLVASIFAVFGVLAFGATVKAQYIAYPIKCADPVQSLSWPSCLLADEKYDYATGKRTATIACENPISGGNCNAPVIAAQLATLNASRKQAIISALQSYKCTSMDSLLYAACTNVLTLGKSCADQVYAALTGESSPYSVSNNPITSANQIYGANLQAIAGYKITSNTGEFTLKSARFDFNGAIWPYVKSIYIYDDLIRLASITDISQSNFEQVPGGLRLMMPFNEADARVRMGQSKTLTVVVEPRSGKGSFDNGMTMPVNGFRVTDSSGLSQYAPAYILPYQVFTINKTKEDISKAVELRFLGGMMAKNTDTNPSDSDSADASITFSLKALDRDIYINKSGYISGKYDSDGVVAYTDMTTGDLGGEVFDDPKTKFTYSCQGCDMYDVNRYIIRQGRTATFVVRGIIYPKIGTVNNSNNYYMGLSRLSLTDDPFQTIGENVYFGEGVPNAYHTNSVYLNYRDPAKQDLSKSVELKYLNSGMAKIDKTGSNPPASDIGDGIIIFSVKALDRDIYINTQTQKLKGLDIYAYSQKGETSDSKTSFTYSCQNCDSYSSDKYIIKQGQTVNFIAKGLVYPAYNTKYYMGLANIRVSATPTGDGQLVSFGPGIPNSFHTDSVSLVRREVSGDIGQNPDIVTLPWNASDYKMSGAVSLNKLSSTGAYVGFTKYTMAMGPGAIMSGGTVYWPYPGATLKKQGDVQTFDIKINKPTVPTLLCYDAFVKYGDYYKRANMQQCTIIR